MLILPRPRRILDQLTTGDIGGCACGLNCYPCPLPAGNLHISDVVAASAGGNAGTYTSVLTFAPGTPNTWTSSCILPPLGGSWRFVLGCYPGSCSFFAFSAYIDTGCVTRTICNYWDNPSNCWTAAPGGASRTVNLSSWVCSPLSIVLTNAPGGAHTWTITL